MTLQGYCGDHDFMDPGGCHCHRGFLNPYFPSWCWRTQSMLLQLASRNYASPNFPQQSKVRNRGDEPSSSYYFLLLSSRGCIKPQKHNQNCEERKNTNGKEQRSPETLVNPDPENQWVRPTGLPGENNGDCPSPDAGNSRPLDMRFPLRLILSYPTVWCLHASDNRTFGLAKHDPGGLLRVSLGREAMTLVNS
jgi:hypothetical protein